MFLSGNEKRLRKHFQAAQRLSTEKTVVALIQE